MVDLGDFVSEFQSLLELDSGVDTCKCSLIVSVIAVRLVLLLGTF